MAIPLCPPARHLGTVLPILLPWLGECTWVSVSLLRARGEQLKVTLMQRGPARASCPAHTEANTRLGF